MKPSRRHHDERRQRVGKKGRSRRGGAIPLRRPDAAAQREQWRSEALEYFVKQTRGLKWSRRLFLLLLEELYVGDEFDEIIGPPAKVPLMQYPQAIAFAIALRNSWRSDDLANVSRALHLVQTFRQ
jgi:hypothetical protein